MRFFGHSISATARDRRLVYLRPRRIVQSGGSKGERKDGGGTGNKPQHTEIYKSLA